jgi:hypothetical protein
MKRYVLTLVLGALGIVSGLITFIHHLTEIQQVWFIVVIGIATVFLGLFERSRNIKQDKEFADIAAFNHLVSEMRHFADNLTNGSEGEKSLEAKILSKQFNMENKVLLYKAIAHVLNVPYEEVDSMISGYPNEWRYVDGLIKMRLQRR